MKLPHGQTIRARPSVCIKLRLLRLLIGILWLLIASISVYFTTIVIAPSAMAKVLIKDYPSVIGRLDKDTSNQAMGVHPFVQANCDLTGVEWYPTGRLAWQKQGPYFLLIGAKKAGTSTLWYWLSRHPWISKARLKEHLYFNPVRFKNRSNKGKVLVHKSRAEIYHPNTGHYNASELSENDHRFAFDATPDYLLYSSRIIPAILCTCPWVKILVSVREPVNRIFSHFNFHKQVLKRNHGSLEQWIEKDLKKLREAGVLQSEIPNEDFYGSDAEKIAWRKYLLMPSNIEFVVGRSLYVIQLEIWYQALLSIGRNPETEVLVVRNEDMRTKPSITYNKVLSWLEFPNRELKQYQDRMKTTYALTEMKNETKVLLKALFMPYNQRLYKLLGVDWTDEWENGETLKVPHQADKVNTHRHRFPKLMAKNANKKVSKRNRPPKGRNRHIN